MEGKYVDTDRIYGTAKESLYCPDFEILFKNHSVNRVERKEKEDSALGKTVRVRRRKFRFAKGAGAFYRRRFLQILLLAVAVTFIFGAIGVHADPKEGSGHDEFVYKVITVESGDTLWGIADTWSDFTDDDIRTYIKKIQEMNHLHGDAIQEGQLLLIYQ